MRKLILFLFLFTHTTLFAQTGTIVITVVGIEEEEGGELQAGIFEEGNFPKVGLQTIGQRLQVNAGTMKVVFNKVPVGYYGIAVFQDIDENQDLKTNVLGFPTEPLGFSNDARIHFGPPPFSDAEIEVEEGKTLYLTIPLR